VFRSLGGFVGLLSAMAERASDAASSYRNGVLEIKLPKAAEAR
jgi:HSP20 family molecular chaperone IbpA